LFGSESKRGKERGTEERAPRQWDLHATRGKLKGREKKKNVCQKGRTEKIWEKKGGGEKHLGGGDEKWKWSGRRSRKKGGIGSKNSLERGTHSRRCMETNGGSDLETVLRLDLKSHGMLKRFLKDFHRTREISSEEREEKNKVNIKEKDGKGSSGVDRKSHTSEREKKRNKVNRFKGEKKPVTE